jgi:hypothetical protein
MVVWRDGYETIQAAFWRHPFGKVMALITCLDCGCGVSDSAVSCPGCGAVLRSHNDLAWPTFYIASAAFIIAVTAPFLSGGMPWWAKLLTIACIGLAANLSAWAIPAGLRHRRLRRQHSDPARRFG